MVQTLIWILCVLLVIAMVVGILWGILGKKKLPPPPPPPPPGSPAPPPTPPVPPTPPTPPAPAPAPIVASPRSYIWLLWWVLIIVVVAYGGRWVWYETQNASKTAPPRVDAPGREKRQKLFISISPLSYNREKSSKGIRIENTGGYYTIILNPGQKIVYTLGVGQSLASDVFIEIHRRIMKNGYMGYGVNEITHKNIFLTGEGLTRFISSPLEFQLGKTELAFFAEEGQLRIDGNKEIVVYEK